MEPVLEIKFTEHSYKYYKIKQTFLMKSKIIEDTINMNMSEYLLPKSVQLSWLRMEERMKVKRSKKGRKEKNENIV